MAATALSDSYSIFMRKIGYSVGLEHTYKRVCPLVKIYLEERDITPQIWMDLESDFDRSPKSFEDFFYSLRLVQRTRGDILVLENLDAMAVSCEILKNKHEREAAVKFLLLWAILVNDGELFVNMLLAGFRRDAIKTTLRKVIRKKRKTLFDLPKGRGLSKGRIMRAINIERQETNKGSKGGFGAGRSIRHPVRTKPLAQLVSRSSAGNTGGHGEIVFSDDYFGKVPGRRKDWACSLGLWADGQVTRCGYEFITRLKSKGYVDADGLFIYWPMDYELVRAGFRSDIFGENNQKGLWDCLVDFAEAYTGLRVRPGVEDNDDADEAFALIKNMSDSFSTLHARKSMLRRELPTTVAYPAAIACACATTKEMLNLPAVIGNEQKSEARRIILRKSRNTEGGLRVKKMGGRD